MRSEPAILILEGDSATRELYRRELGRRYCVRACGDENEAFSILRDQVISAIVLEITTLQDEDWNFVTAARALPNHGSLPIVVCSTVDERRRGAELGVAAYLVKPVVPSTLLDTVDQVLARNGENAEMRSFD